jgi:hypothetical protein
VEPTIDLVNRQELQDKLVLTWMKGSKNSLRLNGQDPRRSYPPEVDGRITLVQFCALGLGNHIEWQRTLPTEAH